MLSSSSIHPLKIFSLDLGHLWKQLAIRIQQKGLLLTQLLEFLQKNIIVQSNRNLVLQLMIQTKNNSYNSTPFSGSKENICPNARFNTINFQKNHKKNQTPSMGTDPQFSVFNTINIARQSLANSIATKSRIEVEAILQDFSTKQATKSKEIVYSHQSFLQLLGLAMGKDDFSVAQAIQKCEQFEIASKNQLIGILEQKEPTREWPLPLSSMMLTDLGQLKVLQLCSHLQNDQDLSQAELQIVEFLIPKITNIENIDKNTIIQHYNEFCNRIDQKFNQVDHLVKHYTLKIQPKISKIKDKVLLVKIQKKLRHYQKTNDGMINFLQLKSCISGLQLNEEEKLITFRYFYFIQNDSMMSIVDRKSSISCSTCFRQILFKSDIPFAKHTISTLELYQTQNNQVIDDLLGDKEHLLSLLCSKNAQIEQLNKQIMLLKIEYQNEIRHSERQRQRQINILRVKHSNQISILQQQNKQKDNLIKWYKNQLEAAVKSSNLELASTTRRTIFHDAYKSIRLTNTGRFQEQQQEQI